MLQFLVKYNKTTFHKYIANIKYTKNNKNKSTRSYVNTKSVVCGVSIFSRKSFFRSILIYSNFQYVNLNLPPENNVFYFPKLVLTYMTSNHLGFLPKKRFIKQ